MRGVATDPRACAEERQRSASSADSSQVMMADSGSSEEVAVIRNTDLNSSESANNVINTVVPFVILYNKHGCSLKGPMETFLNRPKLSYR